jgi:MinD-like ATPase involved in chromosome partitioning or flagellar assembly
MTLVALAGAKGALGVTTLCMGLARTWEEHEKVLVVEADPDGGVLAARLGLSQEPGLSTLAAAGRHELSGELVSDHTQPVHGFNVLVSPSAPSHARAALRSVAAKIGRGPSLSREATVIADLGRLDAESPALPLAQSADIVLLIASPNLEGADALAVRIVELEDLRSKCRLVTVGEGPYEGVELGQVLSIPHVGHVPSDPLCAGAVWGAKPVQRRTRRPLTRAMSSLVSFLQAIEDVPSGGWKSQGVESVAEPRLVEPVTQ